MEIDDLAVQIGELLDAERRRVLLSYAYELTMLSRIYFLDGEIERARACNEAIHRAVGFVLAPEINESMLRSIVAGASQMGWRSSVERALGLVRPA